MKYDYVVVGAGIFGATVAERLAIEGKRVLIIDRRNHLAGNIYSYVDKKTGIEVHKYGSHIFHTEINSVYKYLLQFTEFNDYVHTVNTRHLGKLYPMPINLNTINLFYESKMNADEAREFIISEAKKDIRRLGITEPKNFEEKGISLVGEKLYDAFLKHYTEKQWHTTANNISAVILSRIPVRFSDDNRYFMGARHQGIPVEGYTSMIKKMLDSENIEVRLSIDFRDIKDEYLNKTTIVYCGQVDELFDYEFGVLPWRSLRFEVERTDNGLCEAVVNEADADVPYTRTHDYKYYQIHQPDIVSQKTSIIAKEYPVDFAKGREAYYPVNNASSAELYNHYVDVMNKRYRNIILGGRLGAYQYWDMDKAVLNALSLAKKLL